MHLLFTTHAFQSLESEAVRGQVNTPTCDFHTLQYL